MSVLSVVCCQVEVSATSRSLVRRSPIEWGVSWVWYRNLTVEAQAQWGSPAMKTILQAVTWFALTTVERNWTAENKRSIFIHAFQVDEEKVACRICSFKFTTTGEDLWLKIKPTFASLKSDWQKMRSLTTDRGKIMYGSETGTAGQLRNLRKWALPAWQWSTALFIKRHRAEKIVFTGDRGSYGHCDVTQCFQPRSVTTFYGRSRIRIWRCCRVHTGEILVVE